MDFRNLWRRSFKDLTLLENNNYVLEAKGKLKGLKDHRLVGLFYNKKYHPISVLTTGPMYPDSGNATLITTPNPNAVSFMEWSNNLVEVLQLQGQTITGYFTKEKSPTEVVFTP